VLKILHKIDKKVNFCQKLNIYFLKNFAKNLEVTEKREIRQKKRSKNLSSRNEKIAHAKYQLGVKEITGIKAKDKVDAKKKLSSPSK